MADLFNNSNPVDYDTQTANKPSLYQNQLNTVRNEEQIRLENRKKYGVELSDEEYSQINDLIAHAENPDEESHKIASAILVSQNTKIPLAESYQNLDSYIQGLWGDGEKTSSYKNAFVAISDMFAMGANNIKIGVLGNKIIQAEKDGDEEALQLYMKEYKAYMDDNALRQDNAPRTWATKVLECGAQSTPYTGAVSGAALLGSLLGPAGSIGASVLTSTALMRGEIYMDLRAKGIEPEIARKASLVSAIPQAIIEAGLGEVAAWAGAGLKLLGKGASKTVSSKVAEGLANTMQAKFHFGPGSKLAVRALSEYLGNLTEEGAEEYLQEGVGAIVENEAIKAQTKVNQAKRAEILDTASNELGEQFTKDFEAELLKQYPDLETQSFGEIHKNMVESFKGGVMGAIALGIVPTSINSVCTAADYNLIKEAAENIPSKEMFKKVVKESEGAKKVFEQFGDEKAQNDAISQVWENAQSTRDKRDAELIAGTKETTAFSENMEEAPKENDEGETEVIPAARDDKGRLYTEKDTETETEDGKKKGSFKVGNAEAGDKNLYGYINYTLDEKNNTVTIDDFKMTAYRRGLTQEFFDEFAQEFAGVNINWNPLTKAGKDLKSLLVSKNFTGKNNGLNYYTQENLIEAETRRSLNKQLIKYMPNLNHDQRSAAIALLEAGARRQGYSLSDYVSYTFGNKIFGELKELNGQITQTQRQEMKGATDIKQYGNQIKAVIYAGEKADFSTFAHEVSHIWQAQLTGELKEQAEKAFNVKNGDWINSTFTFADGHTESSAEAFARGFEDYLRTGKAPNAEMKTMFQKFAEFLQDVYRSLKNFINMSPEIENVYNQLMSADDSVLALAEKAVQQGDREYIAELKANKKAQAEAEEKAKAEAKENAEQAAKEKADEESEITLSDENISEPDLSPIEETAEEETAAKVEEKDNVVHTEEEANKTLEDLLNFFGEKAQEETEDQTLNAYKDETLEALEGMSFAKSEAEEVIKTITNKDETLAVKVETTTETAGKARDNEFYIFQLAGREGIKNLVSAQERARRIESYYEALRLAENENNTARRIKLLTGWEKNASGKWVYETDDSIATVNSKLAEIINEGRADALSDKQIPSFALSAIYKNDELYEMYPLAKDFTVQFFTDKLGVNAFIKADGIAVNTTGLTDSNVLKRRLIHEIQHIIQAVENYAEGNDDISGAGIHGKDFNELWQSLKEAQTSDSKMYDASALELNMDKYLNNEAEIDARNVARRALMSANERRASLLSDTTDVKSLPMLFQLIGEQGAENLDKAEEVTTRRDNLKIAKDMEKAGKDAKAIRFATGWEKGTEGLWRYEIDDSQVRFDSFAMLDFERKNPRYNELLQKLYKGENLTDAEQKEMDVLNDAYTKEYNDKNLSESIQYFGKSFRLNEILDNEELYKAYPQLKYTFVSIKPKNGSNIGGRYSPEDKDIVLYVNSDEEWKVQDNLKSTLLHEIQHAIQYIEGFAEGGSPRDFESLLSADELRQYKNVLLNNVEYNNKKAQEILDKINKDIDADQKLKDFYPKFKEGKTLDDWFAYLTAEQEKHPDYEEYKFAKERAQQSHDEAEELGKYRTKSGELITPEQAYYRLAGEVESRNVQARINFTPEERLNTLLAETADVAPEDQIVLFDGVTSESRDNKTNEEVLTTKNYLELTENEKKELIENLERLPYTQIQNVKVFEGIDKNSKKFKEEFPICNLYAEATGETVYLLPEHYSKSSHADALANSIFSDVKNITSQNSTKVLTRFLEGRIQGDNVFIHVNNNKTTVQDVFEQLSRINKEGDKYKGKDKNTAEGKVFVITDYDNKVSLFKINKDGSISEPSYLHPASLNKDSPVFNNINDTNNSVNNIQFQKVYHGSGANFERFNTDEYGLSGEGSMSFGYGTYLTDSEEIARDYAERQGNPIQYRIKVLTEIIKEEEALLKENLSERLRYVKEKDLAKYKDELEKLKKQEPSEEEIRGKRNLYTVEIPDDKFLKWNENLDPKIVEGILKEHRYFYGLKNLLDNYNKWKDNPNATYLYGSNIYKTISKELGSDKAASHFLYNLGFNGIKYPAGTNYGNGNGAYNYVIFDDEEAKIVDHLLFQTQEELMKEAASFDNWEEFMEWEESHGALEEVTPIPKEADAAWYKATWELAKGITHEEKENKTTDESMTQQTKDALFMVHMEQPGVLENFLKEVNYINDLDFETMGNAVDAEEQAERDRQAQLKDYIAHKLRHGSWISNATRVANGKELTPATRKRLLNLIRLASREYRDVYTQITGDQEYAVPKNESYFESHIANNAKKLNKLLTPEEALAMSPEQLRALADSLSDELSNKEISQKIKNGTLKMDDELKNYIVRLDRRVKDAEERYDQLKKETEEDYNRINDYAQRRLLDTYEELLRARAKLNNKKNILDKKIAKGIKITERYQKDVYKAQSTYDDIFKTWNNLTAVNKISAEVQEAMKRKEEYIAAVEEQAKLKNDKAILTQISDMRKKLVKSAMRRVPFERINYEQAKTIIAIQRIFYPNLKFDVNKWIGERPIYLKGIATEYLTNAEKRAEIDKTLNYKRTHAQSDGAKNRIEALQELLKNLKTSDDVDKWTTKEKNLLMRYIPQKDWAKELNLEALEKERADSIQLDIDEEGYTETKLVKLPNGKEEIMVYTRPKFSEEIGQMVKDALGADLYNQLVNKPFEDWTTNEMEKFTKRIDEIYREGRDELEAKRQAKKDEAKEIRDRISEVVHNTGIEINDTDTPEEKEEKLAAINKILGNDEIVKGTFASKKNKQSGKLGKLLHGFADANVRRFARILDNYSEGVNSTELFFKENECYIAEQEMLRKRQKKINAVLKEITDEKKINEIKERLAKENEAKPDDQKLSKEQLQKELNKITASIKIDDLYKTVIVNGNEYSYDDLLYVLAADKDYETKDNDKGVNDALETDPMADNDDYAPTARNAVMFGNLGSRNSDLLMKESNKELDEQTKERHANNEFTEEEQKALDTGYSIISTPGTKSFIADCHRDYAILLNAAKNMLKENPKFERLLEAIDADYTEQFERMQEVCVEEFNAPINRVKKYVPLNRMESNGDTNENRVKEDLLATSGASTGKNFVDKGMTQKRISISPLNQKPVEMGLYKTWADATARTEHFINYAGYVRELNRVYKGRDAQYVRRYIENRYGHGALEYIDNYIAEVANPNATAATGSLDQIVRALRGKTALAYLAWKISGMIKQAATSPWPFMQFMKPHEYLKANLDILTSKCSLYDVIKEKSVYMNNRVFDPVIDLINEQIAKNTNPVESKIENFAMLGMQGLEMIDWVCVAPGWLACYRKKYAELESLNNIETVEAQVKAENEMLDPSDPDRMTSDQIKAEAESRLMSEDDIEKEAVLYADDCTRLCQPSNRKVDLAPLFKSSGPGSEIAKAFLQFQTSLNVIWQNIRYDIPYAMRQKKYKQIVGMIFGYVMAGITVGAITEGFKSDEDDEEKKRLAALRKFIYYGTTQFTDAIPVIGGIVSGMDNKIIAGNKGFTSSTTDLIPMFTKFEKGTENMFKGNWEKALWNYGEAAGLATGLPVSGTKELLRAAGIGDNEEGLDFKPESFIGRRD